MESHKQRIAKRPAGILGARSSLVRRLVHAKGDPAKQRIRRWLSDIDDKRLLSFGLTSEDITLLRGPRANVGTDGGPFLSNEPGQSYPALADDQLYRPHIRRTA